MTSRTAASWIGGLFLTAMVVSIAGNALLLSVLQPDDYLSQLVASEAKLRLAAVLIIANCIAVAGIGALVYKVLHQEHRFVASAYLITRALESAMLLVGVNSLLSLTSVGEAYSRGQGIDITHLSSLGQLAIDHNWFAYNIAMIFLGVGSLFFCYVLLQRRMVPIYLTLLGFAGYAILGLSSVLAILGIDLGLAVTAPVFFFEVILGAWLIGKGFRSSDSVSTSATQ